MRDPSELVAMAKRIIGSNRYMTIGTVDPAGRPWVTPVYFGHRDYRELFWISSREAEHSVNISRRSEVSIVVFDSSVPIGGAEAVYMSGTAKTIESPTEEDCAAAFRPRFEGVRSMSPDELRGGRLRLYRADVTQHWVLIRGNDPVWGRGTDERLPVSL
ncbi:MAG: pyridoxamine 5'-phosphate oxidase family protein [Actinomycetota bacterium]